MGCQASLVGRTGAEVAWLRKVAASAMAAWQGDINAYRQALHAIRAVPSRLAELRNFVNEFGNDWEALVGEDQIRTQLVGVADCRLRSADGASKTLGMTAYSTAVIKQVLGGLKQQLDTVEATVAQRQACWRAVGTHLNGVWMGGQQTNRVLECADGLSLKYSLDPYTERKQYGGRHDHRSAKRKAASRPSSKSLRVVTYF